MTTPERRRRHRGRVLAGFVLLAAAATVLAAAEGAWRGAKAQAKPYALIFGTVFAPDQRPAYGVKVKIRRAAEKKARWEVFSDRQGEFAQRVPAGAADYVVWAEPKGNKGPKPEVKVHIENDERVDFGLHLTE